MNLQAKDIIVDFVVNVQVMEYQIPHLQTT